MPFDAKPAEIRALGCLIEKERTTPDSYPLTLNSLRLACNQATNRDPVVDYDEATVRDAMERLHRRRWARSVNYHGSRVPKFRHLLDEALDLDGGELSILGVLMVRGPQTPGELKQRTERSHGFESLADLQATLERLVERDLIRSAGRRPGQKEQRYVHLLGEDPAETADGGATGESSTESDGDPQQEPDGERTSGAERQEIRQPSSDPLIDRVDALEDEVRSLRSELNALRAELGA